nr:ABC transporter ATP-binding protein [Candidatus Dependentiae bacterium]
TAITNGFEFIIAIAAIISGMIFTWYAVSRILIGDLTIGELIMFGLLAGYLLNPVKQMLSLGPEIQRGIIRAQRFFEVYDIKPPVEPVNPVIIEKIDIIEFDKVYFEYDTDNPVLSGCSFKIDGKKITGIAGKSGCGKSTMINLLCKLNLCTAGTILINGVPIEKISTGQLRKKISSVLQNDILFEGSIKDNFKLISLSIKDSEIIKVLEITGFEFEDYESVIDFKIEENGKNISGGQKFRLLLSRALAKKPEILIIDEGFSNIEPEKESFIMRSLKSNFPDMKIILISHRISSLQFCDKILFIENGIISGYSDYNNLIKENLNFKKLLNSEID